MSSWVWWSLLALLTWGFWGFFPKLATRYMSPQSIIIYEVIAALAVAVMCLFFAGSRPETHPRGILYACLTGVAGLLGGLFYLFAVARGKVSVIVTLTALYPIITIALAAVLLKEPVTLKQGFGMVLAVLSIILLATP
jgi:bacterial/archaeal transporter family protein